MPFLPVFGLPEDFCSVSLTKRPLVLLQAPPERGWKVPWDGEAIEGLLCARGPSLTALKFRSLTYLGSLGSF